MKQQTQSSNATATAVVADTDNHHNTLAELANIRQALEGKGDESAAKRNLLTTLGANGIVLSTSLLLAVVGIIAELISNHGNSKQFIESAQFPNLQVFGLVQIFGILTVLCGALYFFVYRAAKRSNRDFNEYVARNFTYLKNLSFVSDLVVKFAMISVVVLAERPEWVAPLCMLFVGDYLIQGRLFTISLNWAFVLGAVCMLAAVAMVCFNSTLLIWPFIAYAIAAGLSLVQIASLKKAAV